VLISVVGLQPFISTLVLMLAGRGLAKVITGGQNTAASNDTFRWIANGYVLGLPVVFLLAVLIVIAVGLLVRRSALGLMIEAVGMDPAGGPPGRGEPARAPVRRLHRLRRARRRRGRSSPPRA
jgi:ribose/xylose/arabinose/galactoside ABC-type transport system permease subunit